MSRLGESGVTRCMASKIVSGSYYENTMHVYNLKQQLYLYKISQSNQQQIYIICSKYNHIMAPRWVQYSTKWLRLRESNQRLYAIALVKMNSLEARINKARGAFGTGMTDTVAEANRHEAGDKKHRGVHVWRVVAGWLRREWVNYHQMHQWRVNLSTSTTSPHPIKAEMLQGLEKCLTEKHQWYHIAGSVSSLTQHRSYAAGV